MLVVEGEILPLGSRVERFGVRILLVRGFAPVRALEIVGTVEEVTLNGGIDDAPAVVLLLGGAGHCRRVVDLCSEDAVGFCKVDGGGGWYVPSCSPADWRTSWMRCVWFEDQGGIASS